MLTVKKTVIKLTVFCCIGIFQSQDINFTNQKTSVATGSSSPGNQGKSVSDFEVHVYIPYFLYLAHYAILTQYLVTLLLSVTLVFVSNSSIYHKILTVVLKMNIDQ